MDARRALASLCDGWRCGGRHPSQVMPASGPRACQFDRRPSSSTAASYRCAAVAKRSRGEPGSSCEQHQRAQLRAAFGCRCRPRPGRASAALITWASTIGPRLSSYTACGLAAILCDVQLLWDHLSAELWSGRSTQFTVTIPVTNGPLGTVPIFRNMKR